MEKASCDEGADGDFTTAIGPIERAAGVAARGPDAAAALEGST
jgi:hypothetical protein